MSNLFLEDSTMREGEQSPGVSFSPAEKVTLAGMLADLGIHAVEVGTPAMGGAEEEAVRRLVAADLPIRLIGWNRGRRSDLERSFSCGLDSVHIGLPASDHHLEKKFDRSRSWVIDTMQELVAFAKSEGAWVSVSAEDSGRADVDFLVEYATAVKEAGADRMRFSDTVGVLDPFRTYEIISRLVAEVRFDFQPHMHNDYGLATANTLAAVKAGATHVHMTVNGLGDRAGIAPLEEVVMVLERHLGLSLGLRTEGLVDLCEFVAGLSGRPVPANKAIVGKAVFQHESGIHVEGILKEAGTFEPFSPEAVGGQREIVIGKHSGSGALQHVLALQGIETDRTDLQPLVALVRERAESLRRSLEPAELVALYAEVQA